MGTILSGSWSIAGGSALLDSVLPFGDIIGLAIGIGGTIIAGGLAIFNKIYYSEDKDSRLSGNPGDINVEDYKETKIGDDGKATKERHNTDHGYPSKHTNPHDHEITWDKNGNPQFGPAINYPNGAPTFN